MTQTSTMSTSPDYLEPLLDGIGRLNFTAQRKVDPHRTFDEPRNRFDLRRIHLRKNRLFQSSQSVFVEDLEDCAPADNLNAEIYAGDVADSKELDEVRGVVRAFEDVPEGWDGPDSKRPLFGVVQDALEVLQNWASEIDVPEPVLAFDGTVALELCDGEGFTRGGFEFLGRHQAVYTVISRSEVKLSGTFDAESPGEIIRSIAKMRLAISPT